MPRAGLSTLRRRPALSSVEVTPVTSLWLDSSPVGSYFICIWCPERDSNPHTRESKGFWVPRVYHSTIRANYSRFIYFPRVPLSNVVPLHGDSFLGVWLRPSRWRSRSSHIYHSTIRANEFRSICISRVPLSVSLWGKLLLECHPEALEGSLCFPSNNSKI